MTPTLFVLWIQAEACQAPELLAAGKEEELGAKHQLTPQTYPQLHSVRDAMQSQVQAITPAGLRLLFTLRYQRRTGEHSMASPSHNPQVQHPADYAEAGHHGKYNKIRAKQATPPNTSMLTYRVDATRWPGIGLTSARQAGCVVLF